MFVHYTLSTVWVAEWPPFGNSCPLGWPYVPIVILSSCICNLFIYYPFLVSRAGFGFWLLQFLIIAFLLLLTLNIPEREEVRQT